MALCCFAVIFLNPSNLCAAQPQTVSPGKQILWDHARKAPVRYGGSRSAARVYVPKSYLPKKHEVRGVWVSTIGNMDFKPSKTPADFISQYIQLIQKMKKAGFNTIIFQVRPMNDAFYPSKYNPFVWGNI